MIDMSASNAWAELAATYCRTQAAHQEHEGAKSDLKKLSQRTPGRPQDTACGPSGQIGGHKFRAPERWTMQRSSDTIGAIAAALAYARRYALFAPVRIAGEDDLNAPDLLPAPSSAVAASVNPSERNGPKPFNGSIPKLRSPKPLLTEGASASLRDQLTAEIANLTDGDELALWAYQAKLHVSESATNLPMAAARAPGDTESKSEGLQGTQPEPQLVKPLRKDIYRRNRAHLAYVARQPCLVCRRTPRDAHHLIFAQPRTAPANFTPQASICSSGPSSRWCRSLRRRQNDVGPPDGLLRRAAMAIRSGDVLLSCRELELLRSFLELSK